MNWSIFSELRRGYGWKFFKLIIGRTWEIILQGDEKGVIVKYNSKICDFSVLKIISVITKRKHWRKGRFGA